MSQPGAGAVAVSGAFGAARRAQIAAEMLGLLGTTHVASRAVAVLNSWQSGGGPDCNIQANAGYTRPRQ
jgi:hypothetical protein